MPRSLARRLLSPPLHLVERACAALRRELERLSPGRQRPPGLPLRFLRRGAGGGAAAALALRKTLHTAGWPRAARPLFIVGVQRSGTTILVETLGQSLDIVLYDEDHRAAFDNFRLRPPATIAGLVARARAHVVAFKPICDSQWTAELLHKHPGSRAIWIYRWYADAVKSAVTKWGDHARWRFERLLAGDREGAGWWGENLSPWAEETIRAWYRPDMTPEAAYALRWYVRNALVFELGLELRRDVLLLNYERMVRDPRSEFARVFAFIGCDLDPAVVADVHDRSAQRERLAGVPAELARLCEERFAELERAEAATRAPRDPAGNRGDHVADR